MTRNQHIWVASYPKSGNTWVRFLLSNLIFRPVTDSQSIEQMVPDIHRPQKDRKVYCFHDTIFVKTHWKYDSEIKAKYPTKGAIYIVRNPLDVIASHINYFGLKDASLQNERSAFVDTFIQNAGHPRWFHFNMGSWIENVQSWAFTKHGFPILVLRYEDLKSDPQASVRKMAQFLSLEKTQDEIDQAIHRSSFSSLKSLEEKELDKGKNGFFSTEHRHKNNSGYRFMNKGSVGSFKVLMSPKQIREAIDLFAPTMERLGYHFEVGKANSPASINTP